MSASTYGLQLQCPLKSLRLYHKLVLAIGAILLLLSTTFYFLTQHRIERMTYARILDQLADTDRVFEKLRQQQARLLTIVIETVAELPYIKASADMLADPDMDVADLSGYFLEQGAAISRTAGSDIMMVTNAQGRVLSRIVHTSDGLWTYERPYSASDLIDSTQIDAKEGTVEIRLGPQEGQTRRPAQTVNIPAGHLLRTDSLLQLLGPAEQSRNDGSVPRQMTFVDRALGQDATGPRPDSDTSKAVTFWIFRDELYQVATAPLLFAHSGKSVGTIVMGYRIGKDWADDIKAASNGDVSFFVSGRMVATSFEASVSKHLSTVLPNVISQHSSGKASVGDDDSRDEALPFRLDNEEFLGRTGVLPDTECHYVMSLSLTEALRPLRALQRELLGVGLATFIFALFISILVANGVTRPLGGLSTAMEAVMNGDLATRVNVLTPREVAQLAGAFNQMVQGLSEREQFKKMVSRSAAELVEKLAVSGVQAVHTSNKVETTVLFSDIRSFTTMSENLSPEDLVSMLNEYFEAMGKVISDCGGDIDKFIGDAIMAYFKSTPERDGAESAVLCAVQMQNEMKAFNERRRLKNKPEIQIGVGLNSGEVVEGHVGNSDRFEHTVLGDTVNVASRLEGECKKGKHMKIVISQATYDRVKRIVEVVPMGSTKLKGKAEEQPIYEVKALLELAAVEPKLKDPSPQVRARAAEQFCRLVPADQLEPVYELLSDPETIVRATVAGAIAQDPRLRNAASWLLDALDREEEEQVRLILLQALGQVGGVSALSRIEPLMEDPSSQIRRAVLETMGRLGGRGVVELLLKAKEDSDATVRARVGVILHTAGTSEGLTLLEEMSRSDSIEFRRAAVDALGDLGIALEETRVYASARDALSQESYSAVQLIDRVVSLLLQGLQDPEAGVRFSAIQSLTRMRFTPALPVLARLLEDPDSGVADEARRSIQLIGDTLG